VPEAVVIGSSTTGSSSPTTRTSQVTRHFVLFDVYAGARERGAPHYLPRGAGLR
jgi:hypothetical protein